MKRTLFIFGLLGMMSAQAMADELLQIVPQQVSANGSGDDCFTVELVNDDNVYTALQFDLYLPEGMELDEDPIYLSEERFTYKRGTCSHGSDCKQREGFYRIQIFGTSGNTAIKGTNGTLCEIYYRCTGATGDVMPVMLKNVRFAISGTEGVYPEDNVSFFYTESTDFSALTSIDLSAMDGVTTPDVATVARGLMTNPNALLYLNAGSEAEGMQNVIVDGVCKNLFLTDGYGFAAPKAFTAAQASYTRTLGSDGWYSACLPFAATTPEGVTIERFNRVDGSTIYFNEGSVEADKPFIFYAMAGTVEFEVSDVAVAPTPDVLADGDFIGTYSAMEEGSLTGVYALYADGHGFGTASATATSQPFRAYVRSGVANARELTLIHSDDDPTGISTTFAPESLSESYNLSGQRVGNAYKGLIVKDGVKLINN